MLFLCYRRGDYERSALRIHAALVEAFGAQAVFDANSPAAIGSDFDDELETRIRRSDWDTTALQRKGLAAILPMPLEDPAIAPPPPELADQHQRDRFMLAGYGLAKVREEADRGGNV